jgi:hypothetical protein
MMPNKTIYVREADVELWEEAERLAARSGTGVFGRSLSWLVADALRRYIEAEKRKEEGMETIEVPLGGYNDPTRRVAFEGRWLVEPDPYGTRTTEPHYDAGAYWGVALTKRGNVAVWCGHVNDGFDATLDHYRSFEQAEEDGVPGDILAMAAAEIHDGYVQKLDI